VTFLVDNQLPRALARFFVSHGFKAEHLLDLGMDEAGDRAVWDYALKGSHVIVTKDEDFLNLALRPGPAAQVIWGRLGNCRKQALLHSFESALPKVVQALQQGDRVVELR
jgi:predicted nuclease of predicted toxin-antitoxin system